VCRQIFFQTTTVLLQFLKLGTYDLHANVQITVEQIFERLILKFLAIFFSNHSFSFCLILTKLGTHHLCAIVQKTGRNFQISI